MESTEISCLTRSFPNGFLMFSGVEKGCIGNEWVKVQVVPLQDKWLR